MLREESHIREARADTQVHRAPRDYLETLATLYGLPLQATETPHLSQRAFIHEALYSVRGSYTALINQVAGLSGWQSRESRCQVQRVIRTERMQVDFHTPGAARRCVPAP